MSAPKTAAARTRLSQLRHSLVHGMIALIDVDAKRYNQNKFPNPDGKTAICTTPYCAAGFLIQAKDQKLFERICKREAKGGHVDWDMEAKKVLKLYKYRVASNYKLNEVNTGVLFAGTDFWPYRFSDAYRTAKGPRNRFKVMKALWAEFLKHSDAELGVVTAQ